MRLMFTRSDSIGVSIIVPVYNEIDALPDFSAELLEAVAALPDTCEIIWIDDGSTDGTREFLEQLISMHSSSRAYSLPANTKKSGALRLGFQLARGDIVVTIDSDGQDDPACLPTLISRIRQGADVAIGWRQHRSDPLSKRLNSQLINWLSSTILRQPLKDMNSGFKALSREAADAVQFQGSLYRFVPHLLKAEGFTVVEVPVHHRPRSAGTTKFSLLHRYRGIVDILSVLIITRLKDRPLRWFGTAGTVTFGSGAVIFSWLSIQWLLGQPIGMRPLFFTSLFLMLAGIQITSLGIVCELVQQWHRSVVPLQAEPLETPSGPIASLLRRFSRRKVDPVRGFDAVTRR